MLKQSFCFLPKVGEKKEAQLWKQGITDWTAFIEAKEISGISKENKERHTALLKDARKNLFEENAQWFARVLKTGDHWRLYNEFKDNAVYLDIETDGYYGGITVLGMYDNNQTMTFVRGINLDRKTVQEQLSKYKMIVTFNGASFDLPVIKRYFNITHNVPHVDMRFVCQKAGITGGLKQIERDLGIKRANEVQTMTGMEAVNLWQQFRETGNKEHLARIIQYNEEDVINLPILAQKIIPKLWEQTRTL